MVEDKAGNIWYSSENGLYQFDRQSQTVKRKYSISRNKLDGSDYLLVFIDSNDVIWLMSWAHGFASFNTKTEKFKKETLPLKINIQKWVTQNFNEENGNIWFVMYQHDGIYRFNTQTKNISHHFVNE